MPVRQPNPGETSELEVLKVLWDLGPSTVRDIHGHLQNQGRKLAYTTVLTKLQRLQAKGYVVSDKRDVAHLFRAAVSRARLLKNRLKTIADELCDGTTTPLVLALVEGRRLRSEEIDQLRKMLDDLDQKNQHK